MWSVSSIKSKQNVLYLIFSPNFAFYFFSPFDFMIILRSHYKKGTQESVICNPASVLWVTFQLDISGIPLQGGVQYESWSESWSADFLCKAAPPLL